MTQTSTHYCTTHSTFNCRCCEDQTLVPVMSFHEFQSTREECKDLAGHFNDDMTFKGQNEGYTYLDGILWIADVPGKPYWVLIDRDEFSGTDLDEIERALYNYASNAGLIIEPAAAIDAQPEECHEAIYTAIEYLIAERDLYPSPSTRAKKLDATIRTLQAIRDMDGIMDLINTGLGLK